MLLPLLGFLGLSAGLAVCLVYFLYWQVYVFVFPFLFFPHTKSRRLTHFAGCEQTLCSAQ